MTPDGDEDEKDDRTDQQRPLANAPHSGAERGFDAICVRAAILRLVRVGLYGANFVNRLVDVRARVRHPILARARQPPHPTTEKDDGQHHHRQTRPAPAR